MGRKKSGLPIHGWIIIDKPLGVTSTQTVGRIRRLTNAAKVGHAGTLDPLATGLLPIALGEATKTISIVMDGQKSYRFTICFGEERTTDDAEGEVSARSDMRPSDADIEAVLSQFTGEIEQVPPIYSAIKIDGKRAYDLARANEEVEMKSRIVRIDSIHLAERPDADHASFDVTCGKGAYMRALARDIARALGSAGYVSALRRTAVGGFTIEDAIPLEKLEELDHIPAASEHLLPVKTALDDIPALALTDEEARRMRCGQAVSWLKVAGRSNLGPIGPDVVCCAITGDLPVALARVEDGNVLPVRVLNL